MRKTKKIKKRRYLFLENKGKKAFTECNVKVVFVKDEDVVRTSGGAEVGKDIDGALTDWNTGEPQG